MPHPNASPLFEAACARIDNSPLLAPDREVILAGYETVEEHLEWLLSASDDDIKDWVDDLLENFSAEFGAEDAMNW